MKTLTVLLAGAGAVAVGRHVSHRLATHQRVLPNPLARINTRVHRINQ